MNGKLAILPQKLIEMLMTADREKFKEVVTNLVKKHNPLAVTRRCSKRFVDGREPENSGFALLCRELCRELCRKSTKKQNRIDKVCDKANDKAWGIRISKCLKPFRVGST